MASNSRLESTWCAAAMNAGGTKITIIQRVLPGLLETHEPAPSGLKRIYSTDGGSGWKIPSENSTEEFPTDSSQIGEGVFNSGPAAAVSGDGKKLHVFARGKDNRIWRAASNDGGKTWNPLWGVIGQGTLSSAPAAVASADGKKLYVFARGQDTRIWYVSSSQGGADWGEQTEWKAIGQGKLTSAPAAATGKFGAHVHVFGRGNDDRMWHASSSQGGNDWGEQTGWERIGARKFRSAPAATVSDDGKKLHVFGRGTDDRIWHTFSSQGGDDWHDQTGWLPISEGIFSSGPAAVVSADGQKLHVFGRGVEPPSSATTPGGAVLTFTPGLWRAFSSNGGVSWDLAWKHISPGHGPV